MSYYEAGGPCRNHRPRNVPRELKWFYKCRGSDLRVFDNGERIPRLKTLCAWKLSQSLCGISNAHLAGVPIQLKVELWRAMKASQLDSIRVAQLLGSFGNDEQASYYKVDMSTSSRPRTWYSPPSKAEEQSAREQVILFEQRQWMDRYVHHMSSIERRWTLTVSVRFEGAIEWTLSPLSKLHNLLHLILYIQHPEDDFRHVSRIAHHQSGFRQLRSLSLISLVQRPDSSYKVSAAQLVRWTRTLPLLKSVLIYGTTLDDAVPTKNFTLVDMQGWTTQELPMHVKTIKDLTDRMPQMCGHPSVARHNHIVTDIRNRVGMMSGSLSLPEFGTCLVRTEPVCAAENPITALKTAAGQQNVGKRTVAKRPSIRANKRRRLDELLGSY